MALSAHTSLTQLSLRGMALTEHTVAALATLSALRSLDIAGEATGCADAAWIGANGQPEALRQLTSLTHLDISQSSLDVPAAVLAACTELRTLRACDSLQELAPLAQLAHLRCLGVSGAGLAGLGQALQRMRGLTELELGHMREQAWMPRFAAADVRAVAEALSALTGLRSLHARLPGNELRQAWPHLTLLTTLECEAPNGGTLLGPASAQPSASALGTCLPALQQLTLLLVTLTTRPCRGPPGGRLDCS